MFPLLCLNRHTAAGQSANIKKATLTTVRQRHSPLTACEFGLKTSRFANYVLAIGLLTQNWLLFVTMACFLSLPNKRINKKKEEETIMLKSKPFREKLRCQTTFLIVFYLATVVYIK